MKKAAVINDLSGFGKCSLTAALPVLSAIGVQCCPLPTAVLTGQTGYPFYHYTDLVDLLPRYIEAWEKNNAHFDAIYTGFMMESRQIPLVQEFLARFRTDGVLLLVDPVMGDDGKVFGMFCGELLDGMKKLTRQADLITPNLTEACLLADIPLDELAKHTDFEDAADFALDVAEQLRARADVPQDVVITGIKSRGEDSLYICNLALTERGEHLCCSPCFDRSFSGTGDLFASVMCGCRARGIDTGMAMDLATDFLYHSIEDTMKEETDRNDGVNFEQHLEELIIGVHDYFMMMPPQRT